MYDQRVDGNEVNVDGTVAIRAIGIAMRIGGNAFLNAKKAGEKLRGRDIDRKGHSNVQEGSG